MKIIIVQREEDIDARATAQVIIAIFAVPDDFDFKKDRSEHYRNLALLDKIRLTKEGNPIARHTGRALKSHWQTISDHFGNPAVEYIED